MLGHSKECSPVDAELVAQGPLVTGEQCRSLVRAVSDKEIFGLFLMVWEVTKPLARTDSLLVFFKRNWNTIGKELCNGVRHCLRYNDMPKGVNAAYIVLIPKSSQASKPEDFRPISCCNITYKIVSSLLAGRLKEVLPHIINPAQEAFIKDRSIVDNICLAQQLFHGYGRSNISERLAWKIDLRKAYDTIDWKFLISMLRILQFPCKFIAWMEMCLQSTSYSIMINGEMNDFFEGKRGIRQGDPLSPFLFTIAMECLSRMLQRLNKADGFYHHPKCHRIKLSYIMFADDLIVFSSGRQSAISDIKRVVSQFLKCSGLAINFQKSHLFLGGMTAVKVEWVEEVMGTRASPLPVPSRAGRRVCILPKIVIHAVNAICAKFLWKGNCEKKGGHLVKWNDVCKSKEEGGLGLKNIERMNLAMVTNQIWGKYLGRASLWTDLLEKYWSKGKHWWEEEIKSNISWVLKRLMQCKEVGLRDPVDWFKLVWNSFNAPRDSLNAWLAVQDKLLTRDRMSHWGIQISKSCALCQTENESRDHLFFECNFTQEVWTRVLAFLLIVPASNRWDFLIPWFKGMPQPRLKTKMAAAAITRLMNGVWNTRNKKIFREEDTPTALIIQDTIRYLKMKIGAVKMEGLSKADRDWLRNLGFID
ncbi:hypothetical protein QQ045_026252 [Rhodiola kirilowii]